MAAVVFRWNEWNLEHATRHGVGREEIEAVVRDAARPYPQRQGRGKWIVIGRGTGGRFVQVIFLLDPDGTRYVIHARPVRRPRR